MSKVTHISAARSYSKPDASLGGLSRGVDLTEYIAGELKAMSSRNQKGELERLNEASSHHLLALLELAHKDEEHAREQAQARETLDQELEASAYAAFISGVPEEDIYNLDTHVGTALENAIRKVQAIA